MKNGDEVVIDAKPSPAFVPGSSGLGVAVLDRHSKYDYQASWRDQDQIEGTFHTHPAGDNNTFEPAPSNADLRNANFRARELGIKGDTYVLSIQTNTVHIIRPDANAPEGSNATIIATFPLKKFTTITAK